MIGDPSTRLECNNPKFDLVQKQVIVTNVRYSSLESELLQFSEHLYNYVFIYMLSFFSDLPPVKTESIQVTSKAPTGAVEFRDDIDLIEQVRNEPYLNFKHLIN